MLFGQVDRAIGLEFQAEIDRRIDEIGHRGEGHDQGRRHAAEAEADRKLLIVDLEVPEAVLDDDRHLVGEALDQMLGDRNARHAGLEGDVEMMAARQPAALLHLAQHPADDVAQGLLHDLVVRNQGLRGFLTHRFSW